MMIEAHTAKMVPTFSGATIRERTRPSVGFPAEFHTAPGALSPIKRIGAFMQVELLAIKAPSSRYREIDDLLGPANRRKGRPKALDLVGVAESAHLFKEIPGERS